MNEKEDTFKHWSEIGKMSKSYLINFDCIIPAKGATVDRSTW